MTTDFEEYGYSKGPIPVRGRYWLLTVDFEAFTPDNIAAWLSAMRHWAVQAGDHNFRFCFFMSIEDVVSLKANSPEAYDDFLECAAQLYQSGTRFHPHNHSVFDPETGASFGDTGSEPPSGYTKRVNMFHRAHYQHKVDFATWMDTVRACYERFLADLRVPVPDMLAFRAGGWDYGSTSEDLHRYLEALAHAGYRVDSSACSGAFGTDTWRIGSDYLSNVFLLDSNLIEVAPNLALNCGQMERAPSSSRLPYLFRELVRSPSMNWSGIYVHVLHFDHLFHELDSGAYRRFAVTDPDAVRRRIDQFFRTIRFWRRSVPLESATFDDIEFLVPEPGS